MGLLTIVVPCFNESDCLETFYHRITSVLSTRTDFGYELIFINDGSSDQTAAILDNFAQYDERVKVVEFSRNFGKESALSAGLKLSKGDMVVPMDADLQHPPETILEMIDRFKRGGVDVVIAMRESRSTESMFYRIATQWFYKIGNFITNSPIPPKDAGDFRLMSRAVVNSLNELPETQRYMKGLYAWVGYSVCFIPYKVEERLAGQSKFSTAKLLSLATNGLLDFSVFPLRIWLVLGLFFAIIGFMYALWIIIKTFIYGADVPGYASIISSILFLGGLQLISIGVIGEYIGRIYTEIKGRPSYVIRKIYQKSKNG